MAGQGDPSSRVLRALADSNASTVQPVGTFSVQRPTGVCIMSADFWGMQNVETGNTAAAYHMLAAVRLVCMLQNCIQCIWLACLSMHQSDQYVRHSDLHCDGYHVEKMPVHAWCCRKNDKSEVCRHEFSCLPNALTLVCSCCSAWQSLQAVNLISFC